MGRGVFLFLSFDTSGPIDPILTYGSPLAVLFLFFIFVTSCFFFDRYRPGTLQGHCVCLRTIIVIIPYLPPSSCNYRPLCGQFFSTWHPSFFFPNLDFSHPTLIGTCGFGNLVSLKSLFFVPLFPLVSFDPSGLPFPSLPCPRTPFSFYWPGCVQGFQGW